MTDKLSVSHAIRVYNHVLSQGNLRVPGWQLDRIERRALSRKPRFRCREWTCCARPMAVLIERCRGVAEMTDKPSAEAMREALGKFAIPNEANGLRLCKIVGQKLILCDPVIFTNGAPSVDTALRRAEISGSVGPIGETGDFWADVMRGPHEWIETIALSRRAWNALKNKWMRCNLTKSSQ